jgi:hypothetical protein
MTAKGTAVFSEAVAMVADALGIELDDIVCEAEYAKTTTDLDLGSWQIAAGCVAGIAASWKGRIGDRTIIELNVRWKKAPILEPDGRSRTAASSSAGTSDPGQSCGSSLHRTFRPSLADFIVLVTS